VSFLDRILGRTKKTVGEAVDDPALRREGRIQERKGEAQEELSREQERVQEKAAEVAELEAEDPKS
jgi:uncharacterized protein YjbJ (UPF0337 family)